MFSETNEHKALQVQWDRVRKYIITLSIGTIFRDSAETRQRRCNVTIKSYIYSRSDEMISEKLRNYIYNALYIMETPQLPIPNKPYGFCGH